ncbi:MAG: response regulator transcription factor [Clostridiales bacterium]|nr:response regulator transcription factor [Clostridiales bacterium]
MRTVLIVDDEKNIVDILKFNLQKEGYNTVEAYDGKEAMEKFDSSHPDLVLLDVMLPRLSGFEVCRRIRESDNLTPIIMLTARGEETDKVLGLEIGADDYITKPFSIREVTARVNANMRRTAAVLEADETRMGFVIDEELFDVFINGKNCGLTPREFDLIKFIAASPGKVFSREDLLRDVWQYDYFGDLRSVDVAVRRLREKIEEDSSSPKYVMTRRGVGYYFVG